jgi:hypothetical protein
LRFDLRTNIDAAGMASCEQEQERQQESAHGPPPWIADPPSSDVSTEAALWHEADFQDAQKALHNNFLWDAKPLNFFGAELVARRV